jgi:type VI secretion system FHA domain protein
LSDTSINGIIINDQKTPLHNAMQRIDNDTRLEIGEYELHIVITDIDKTIIFPNKSESTIPPVTKVNDLSGCEEVNTNSLIDGDFSGFQAPPIMATPFSEVIPVDFDIFEEPQPNSQSFNNDVMPDDWLKDIEPVADVINTESVSSDQVKTSNNEDAPIVEPLEKNSNGLTDSVLFNEFLQGAGISYHSTAPERQKETLHRIGQLFRKLINGTVAVLRSRTEFKRLCRVNMTVISNANNNPLKFTISIDDLIRQLLENKTEGFLGSTAAIDESFSDIMSHQLAMQAGIQASLADLLKNFDPKIIEKQFEQGIFSQKKAKCWDKFEETYLDTVDNIVENFYGDAFVKAYEQQIRQLTNQHKK